MRTVADTKTVEDPAGETGTPQRARARGGWSGRRHAVPLLGRPAERGRGAAVAPDAPRPEDPSRAARESRAQAGPVEPPRAALEPLAQARPGDPSRAAFEPRPQAPTRRLIEPRWRPDELPGRPPETRAQIPSETPGVAEGRPLTAAPPAAEKPRARARAWLPRPHRAVIVVSAIVLAVGMSVAVSNASRWGRTAESFVLEQVEVRGNRVLTDAEVTALSGLSMGTNLLTVRIGDVESAVARSPRVARVRASRALPGKVVVTLDERVPIAVVAAPSGRALEVTEDGAVLPPVEQSVRVDLPVITGVEAPDGTPSGEDLERALDLIVLAREASPSFAAEISEVRIAPGSGLVIYTVADGAEIRVGSGALDARGMKRLSLVLSDLRARGVRAESIDVRFRDQIVVRPGRELAAGGA